MCIRYINFGKQPRRLFLPFVKDEKDGEADARKAGGVVLAKLFTKVGHGKDRENGKRDYLSDSLKLSR